MRRYSLLMIFGLLMVITALGFALSKNSVLSASGLTLSFGPPPHRLLVAVAHPLPGPDPNNTDPGSALLCANIYEGLVRFKPGTALVEPCLATSWETSPDGLVWTFKLRPGVTFHDGTPFNAEAVQLNFARYLNRGPDQSTGDADFIFAALDRVEVADQQTVKLHLKYPYAPLLNNLALPMAASIISPAAFSPGNQDYKSKNIYPAGTGPYIWAGESAGGVLLKSNRKHWQSPPRTEEILFTTVAEAEKRAQLLQKGKIHVALNLSSQEINGLEKQGYTTYKTTGLDICYLGFYTQKEPFNRKTLRKAVTLALDRTQIMNGLWPRDVRPALGILPPTIPGYRDDKEDHPPDEARQLLQEADRGEGFAFTLITYRDPRPYTPGGGEQLAQSIVRALAGANIEVKVKAYSWEEYKKALARQEGDAFLYGWISDNGDADNFLYTLLSPSQIQAGQNITGYRSEPLEDLLLQARQTTDPETRRRLYGQAQDIINQDAPLLVLGHSLHYAAAAPAVNGFIPSPADWHMFHLTTRQ